MVDYIPAGRTGRFDVPAYADMADLQILFKRFANTVAASRGDTLTGDYTLTGDLTMTGDLVVNGMNISTLPAVRRTGAFAVTQDEARARTTFICSWANATNVTVPSPAGLVDGARFTLIQIGAGAVGLSGTTVDGKSATVGQWQKLDVILSSNRWVSVDGPIGPAGAPGPNPMGGAVGDILTRGAAEGELAWSAPGTNGLPAGGVADDILVKTSSDAGDADWLAPSQVGIAIPPLGTTGQVLTKLSDASFDVGWSTPAAGGGGAYEPASVVVAIEPYPTGGVQGSGETDCWKTWTDGDGTGHTYRVHKFIYDAGVPDYFIVTKGVIGTILMIGGGGAGGSGSSWGGTGGGAGALWTGAYALGNAPDGSPGGHRVVIGNGGAPYESNGEITKFDDVWSLGGGGGTNFNGAPGKDGGCGGGGGHQSIGFPGSPGHALGGSYNAGATYTKSGWHCNDGWDYYGTEGGGCGTGGAAGFDSAITGSVVTYGTGGTSGNGSSNGVNGTGSGGCENGRGGSGIVIISYRIT